MNIILVIIVVAFVGTGAYFVFTRQITPPAPSLTPVLSPISILTPKPNPTTNKPPPTRRPATTGSDNPIIKIITPNGGEQWKKGSTETIRWSVSQSIARVSIFLEPPPCIPSPGQACVGVAIKAIPITLNLANTGAFDWTIQYDTDGKAIPTGEYLIRIEGSPFAPDYRYDYSNGAFDIQ